MKRRQSLISKLLLVSSVILLSVAGIIAIALYSFNHVEDLLLTGVSNDIDQMITNANMGRKLSQVLADTNLLVSTFSEREEFLKTESERLLTETFQYKASLTKMEQQERISPPLETFIHRLKAILDQAASINTISRKIQQLDRSFAEKLETVDDAVTQKLIAASIGGDESQKSAIEKLGRLVPTYRQMLAQATIQLGKSRQAHLGLEPVETPYEAKILEILRSLGADLAMLTTIGGEDLAPLGKGFFDDVSQYKEHIVILHQAFRTFQEQLGELKRAERKLVEVMEEIDTAISLSTQRTFVRIANNITASERFMLTLSAVIFVVMLFLGFYAIRIVQPIKTLADVANCFAEGSLSCHIQQVASNDEIGVLSRSFQRLIRYMQDMAQVATGISQGNLTGQIQPKSEEDVLGQAFLKMVEYVRSISAVMTNIAEGNLRETVRPRSSGDTFGQVIHTMTEGLRSLIVRIRKSSEQIAATGETIAELATHDIHIVGNAKQAVEHLVAIMDDMRGSVDEVANNMQLLSSSVELTSASVSQMTASIGQIATNANDLTHQSRQTIDAMNHTLQDLEQVVEQVDASKRISSDTNQDAHDGQQAVEQVMSSMKIIRRTVMTAVEAINRFSQRSQDIDSILEVIRNITEQTTLLALNASIIAAQAGSHGRGFAVVADEIKSLADGVGVSTKDIAEIVQSLKKDTAEVVQTVHEGVSNVQQGVEHTQQARDALHKILLSAERSSAVVSEIAETVHNLKQTSHQVASAMQEVDRMTNDITTATNEQKATTEQIDQSVGHINTMAAQTQQATSEQLDGVQQVLEVASEVSDLIIQNQESSHHITRTTEDLSSQAALLLKAVDRFKLPASEKQ